MLEKDCMRQIIRKKLYETNNKNMIISKMEYKETNQVF